MVNPTYVSQASPSEYGAALRLIFAHLAQDQQHTQIKITANEARAGRVSLEGIFVAKRSEKIVGATWCQVLPGHTAAVWPPRLEVDEAQGTLGQLYDAATRYLTTRQVRLAQCLVDTDCSPDAQALREAGFEYAADLLYMVSTRDAFPESRPSRQLEYEPYVPANQQRLASLVQRTYRDTLDCPALDGVRSLQDVLDGYEATGEHDPGRWLYIRTKTADVGCLLLADHPREKQWELIYMGLVPEARGHGWGLEATRYAQWLTGQAQRDRLVLAVDAANRHAVRSYAAAGFTVWDRRSVFMKVFDE